MSMTSVSTRSGRSSVVTASSTRSARSMSTDIGIFPLVASARTAVLRHIAA